MHDSYFRQFLDLVGIKEEFLQGLLKAKDLLRNRLQAAVGVVQRCHRLLLTPQAAARHQANKQTPLGHPQGLERRKKLYRKYIKYVFCALLTVFPPFPTFFFLQCKTT